MAKNTKNIVTQHFNITELGPVFKATGKTLTMDEYNLVKALLILGIGQKQSLSTLTAQLRDGKEDDNSLHLTYRTASALRNRQNALFGEAFKIEITGSAAEDTVSILSPTLS
tara:strand:+ start:2122 stop:2457 length:336 start_codon:yes stop_codon:yes gene_type:complete